MITRKKEKVMEELKHTEEEQGNLEKQVIALTEKINKEKGQGFGNINNINGYVKNL